MSIRLHHSRRPLPHPPGDPRNTYSIAQLAKRIGVHASIVRLLLCRSGLYASSYERQRVEDETNSEFPRLMIAPTPDAIAQGWAKGMSLTGAGYTQFMSWLRGRTQP